LSAIGILLQLSYRLHRHFVAGWSVGRWLGALLFLAGLAVLIARRSITWEVILVAALFLIYLGILLWAGRKGYVRFRASASAATLLQRAPALPSLQPEELVPVRAGGRFTVEGHDQYYMDLEANYESVRSREHIILARVSPSRFLLLGSWPDYELGCWYIFFRPGMLRQIRAGSLHFGPQPRLAIEITYMPDEETRHSVYLASEAALLRRIWKDLMRDAPSDMNTFASGDVG
jgi:hypothetical protein